MASSAPAEEKTNKQKTPMIEIERIVFFLSVLKVNCSIFFMEDLRISIRGSEKVLFPGLINR